MALTRESVSAWLLELQDSICGSLEEADGKGKFTEDLWTRPEGGGGRTRIITNGDVIEKGGVLYSAVHGDAPEFLLKESGRSSEGKPQFYATGVSIVIHPQSPMVPIIHMNIRYFEMTGGVRWLGGGIDLTPHYVDEGDATFFHNRLKAVCDRHHATYYDRFRKWADDYFFITHRQETRGIGGIFFDRLQEGDLPFEGNYEFWQDVGRAFAPLYTTLMRKNSALPFGAREKKWQLLRRGRYVEFNLVYDRGTKFGLETNGRVESILMSLPAVAGWEYNFIPEEGSAEAKTLSLLKRGHDWIRTTSGT